MITQFLSVEIRYIIVYVLEVAIIYCRHFRSHPYEIMKWKFEERWVHISYFQVPSIVCLLTYCNNSAKCMSDSCGTIIILDLSIILTFFFIILLCPLLKMLYVSSVRTVDSVNISCAFCDHCFCHCIPIWQESHCVSNNCTVVLQADASDNEQNNVQYFN